MRSSLVSNDCDLDPGRWQSFPGSCGKPMAPRYDSAGSVLDVFLSQLVYPQTGRRIRFSKPALSLLPPIAARPPGVIIRHAFRRRPRIAFLSTRSPPKSTRELKRARRRQCIEPFGSAFCRSRLEIWLSRFLGTSFLGTAILGLDLSASTQFAIERKLPDPRVSLASPDRTIHLRPVT